MDGTAEYFLKLDFTLQLAHKARIRPGATITKYMGSNMGNIGATPYSSLFSLECIRRKGGASSRPGFGYSSG
jgi:uncharacterized SAM-dependent methyltransferase